MKKNGGVGLALAGLAILVVGILLGTVWKPASSVSATVAPDGKGVLVTAPGVLDMGGTDVEVAVSGPAQDTISVGAGFSGDGDLPGSGIPHYADVLRGTPAGGTHLGVARWAELVSARESARADCGAQRGGPTHDRHQGPAQLRGEGAGRAG